MNLRDRLADTITRALPPGSFVSLRYPCEIIVLTDARRYTLAWGGPLPFGPDYVSVGAAVSVARPSAGVVRVAVQLDTGRADVWLKFDVQPHPEEDTP